MANLEFAVPKPVEVQVMHVDGFIVAGFPSPASDYLETSIDIFAELIPNPDATFVCRVVGDSMIHARIEHGDVLVVDRSLTAKNGSVAVCCLNGEFTVKRLEITGERIRLMAANPDFPPIELTDGDLLEIWGVVTSIIKRT